MTHDKNSKYDDIINLPHHVSYKYPQMSVLNRAAQFAPFAALTGYEDAVNETARLTDKKVELDDNAKEILDAKLQLIQEHLVVGPEVRITYFQKDEKKEGGKYLQVNGRLKKIDMFNRIVSMEGEVFIAIDDILKIEGELFGELE